MQASERIGQLSLFDEHQKDNRSRRLNGRERKNLHNVIATIYRAVTVAFARCPRAE
jgi:hypothetical protein